MKQVMIKITDRDFDTLLDIGGKPWSKTTEQERKEYDRLIQYYGVLIAYEIRRPIDA